MIAPDVNLLVHACEEDSRFHIGEKAWLYKSLSGRETIGLPGPRHFELLRQLLIQVGTGGNLTSDAHLAAIALERGAEVYSTDADFGRFSGLRWHNPIAS